MNNRRLDTKQFFGESEKNDKLTTVIDEILLLNDSLVDCVYMYIN